MPNVTISVPDELKTEMDKFPEVSWSEICRNAISQYIAQRKNPTPNIELTLAQSSITHFSYDTGYPTLNIDLTIHNKMDSDITVDRILSKVMFHHPGENRIYPIGVAYDLRRRNIKANSNGSSTIRLILHKEKLLELKGVFKSTFDCQISCAVFVDGFRNEYHQDVKTTIPIDIWKDVLNKVLRMGQS